MRAAVIHRFGPASVLELAELPVPVPGEGQVLVEVHAAAVNPIDWKIREGWMRQRYGEQFPMVLGFDAAGAVSAVGPGVSGLSPGDAVYARSDIGPGGCYAEYALLNADTVARKPRSMNQVEAAAVPLAALTALNGLRDAARLQPGDTVLVNGASGGVGCYAVQIARRLGAEVVAVCSGRNAELARELGASEVIDYTQHDPLAGRQRYRLIYDAVGTLDFERARGRLDEQGIYLTLVPAEGIKFLLPGQGEPAPGGGYFLVWQPRAADLALLADWADAGQLRSVIDSCGPLADVRAAHERSETGHARGKIVLQLRDESL